jgi:hypothetical protein
MTRDMGRYLTPIGIEPATMFRGIPTSIGACAPTQSPLTFINGKIVPDETSTTCRPARTTSTSAAHSLRTNRRNGSTATAPLILR